MTATLMTLNRENTLLTLRKAWKALHETYIAQADDLRQKMLSHYKQRVEALNDPNWSVETDPHVQMVSENELPQLLADPTKGLGLTQVSVSIDELEDLESFILYFEIQSGDECRVPATLVDDIMKFVASSEVLSAYRNDKHFECPEATKAWMEGRDFLQLHAAENTQFSLDEMDPSTDPDDYVDGDDLGEVS